MDLDDLDPRQKTAKPKDLASYSVEELSAYVALLRAEILRAEAAIAEKSAQKHAASAIFR
jgi:uncharacterized small protein (DUF1192 family)